MARGRPRKLTVDYFPHYTGASDGKTIFILQSKFGNDGYAFWFKLLEILGSSEGHFFDYRKTPDWEFLLAKTGISDNNKATEILNTLADLDTIDIKLHEQKVIWSQNFVDNLADLYKRRQIELPRKPVISADNKLLNADSKSISTSSNHQSKVKDSKGKDIREEGGMGETDRDDLYRVLEDTKGFPKYTQENAWKLIDVMRDYPGLNYLLEFKKFKEYWNTRQLKRSWLALRNWLDKAKEKGEKTRGRGLPKEYTPTADYPDL